MENQHQRKRKFRMRKNLREYRMERMYITTFLEGSISSNFHREEKGLGQFLLARPSASP